MDRLCKIYAKLPITDKKSVDSVRKDGTFTGDLAIEWLRDNIINYYMGFFRIKFIVDVGKRILKTKRPVRKIINAAISSINSTEFLRFFGTKASNFWC